MIFWNHSLGRCGTDPPLHSLHTPVVPSDLYPGAAMIINQSKSWWVVHVQSLSGWNWTQYLTIHNCTDHSNFRRQCSNCITSKNELYILFIHFWKSILPLLGLQNPSNMKSEWLGPPLHSKMSIYHEVVWSSYKSCTHLKCSFCEWYDEHTGIAWIKSCSPRSGSTPTGVDPLLGVVAGLRSFL